MPKTVTESMEPTGDRRETEISDFGQTSKFRFAGSIKKCNLLSHGMQYLFGRRVRGQKNFSAAPLYYSAKVVSNI